MTDIITASQTVSPQAQSPTAPAAPDPILNPEQSAALEAILAWLKLPADANPFFVLRGYAGTGKTFLIKQVVKRLRGRLVFTAPTNKATKVLRESLTGLNYKPECKTIYSLLGLRLEPNGEIKELREPEDPVDLTQFSAIVVDEGSMVSAMLDGFIRRAARSQNLRFIYLGDPAQLPPVKESQSPIWADAFPATKSNLTQVMRHDNTILTLATVIRNRVDHPAPSISIRTDVSPDSLEGVWRVGPSEFNAGLIDYARKGLFQSIGDTKAIAWRNVEVDSLNKLIRTAIFNGLPGRRWVEDDRAIFTEPAKDFEDEIIATTDDEGRVSRVLSEYHPLYPEFLCDRVTITIDGGNVAVAWVLDPSMIPEYTRRVEALAQAAKVDRRKWSAFWEFKEAFHQLRHAYALTAHRSQGSTYKTVFVNSQDILRNQNRNEGFRCLYVACTRPQKRLIIM